MTTERKVLTFTMVMELWIKKKNKQAIATKTAQHGT